MPTCSLGGETSYDCDKYQYIACREDCYQKLGVALPQFKADDVPLAALEARTVTAWADRATSSAIRACSTKWGVTFMTQMDGVWGCLATVSNQPPVSSRSPSYTPPNSYILVQVDRPEQDNAWSIDCSAAIGAFGVHYSAANEFDLQWSFKPSQWQTCARRLKAQPLM